MVRFLSYRSPLPLAVAALSLAACTGTAPKGAQPISLSFTTNTSNTPRPSASNIAAAIQIGSGANSISITKVQVVLARIELSPSGTCDPVGEEDDCDEVHVGPQLVDLPVDGSAKVALDALVPTGTYNSLHAKLDAVRTESVNAADVAFLKANPTWVGLSVQVTGVFTDASNATHNFTFSSEADAHIEAQFSPAVTVGSSTSNLTVSVDIPSWFKNETGGVIDPTNTANAALIDSNIQRSFRAFEDDDHDGVDDHNEGSGGHES